MTISQWIHWKVFRDDSTSLCGRAYALQRTHLFWRLWVMVFTYRHCRESYSWHHQRVNSQRLP